MPSGESDAVPAQILIKLGEMGAQLAVIHEQLKTAAFVDGDHETRLRALERARWPLPTIAVIAAVGSTVAAVLAYVHH